MDIRFSVGLFLFIQGQATENFLFEEPPDWAVVSNSSADLAVLDRQVILVRIRVGRRQCVKHHGIGLACLVGSPLGDLQRFFGLLAHPDRDAWPKPRPRCSSGRPNLA